MVVYIVMWVILAGIAFGLLAWLFGSDSKAEDTPSKRELERITSTEVGKYKVEAAIRQARRLGVGILLYDGRIYSIVTKDSPKQRTQAFKDAYQKALDEKLKKHS